MNYSDQLPFHRPHAQYSNSKLKKNRRLYFSCLILTLMANMTSAFADNIDCNNYSMPALKQICERFSIFPIHIYPDLQENGLNTLVDNWGRSSGLVLLPAQEYTLNKAISLGENQAVLPILSQENSLSMITLRPSEDFKVDGNFRLLTLNSGSAIGGVSVAVSSLPETLSTDAEQSALIQINAEGNDQVVLTGSNLVGDNRGKIYQLIRVTGSQYYSGKVLLEKNLLSTEGLERAVFSKLYATQQLEFKDNFMAVPYSSSAGLEAQGGIIQVHHNDIEYSDDCFSNCLAFSLKKPNSFVISSNAFWVSDSHSEPNVLFLASPALQQGELTFNSLVKGIGLVSGSTDSIGQLVMDSNNFNLPAGKYPWSKPEMFFYFSGSGGVNVIPFQILSRLPEYINFNGTRTDFGNLHQPVSPSNRSAFVFSLCDFSKLSSPDIPGYCLSPESGFSQNGAISQFVLSGFTIITAIITIVAARKLGVKNKNQYQLLQVDDNI